MTKLFRPIFTYVASLIFLVFMLFLGVKNLYLGEANLALSVIFVCIIAAAIALKVYLRRRS